VNKKKRKTEKESKKKGAEELNERYRREGEIAFWDLNMTKS
jgi:hypothetical protein